MILTILVLVAVAIVLALAVYAGWLLWKLHEQKKTLAEHDAVFAQKKIEHEDYLIDSIRIIAQNLVEEDLNVSEGAIRLKFLLDGLGLPEEERTRFLALDALHGKVKDFDTHEARKQLSPKERMRQDSEREAHEADHRDHVIEVAEVLMRYDFSGFGSPDRSTPHH